MILVNDPLQDLITDGALIVKEQLPDLFLVGHAGDGLFDPGDILIGQIIGFCAQIDHNNISFTIKSAVFG